MKTHYLKIRDKFIDNVATGLKRHEYRLATVERRQIQIGDTLILVSNQNRRKFVKVIVKGVSKFASWEQALKDNWEQDFKSIFSSFEEALKECNKFYTRDEIHSYGIIAFDIEPITVDYRKTCILLDTNIIIKRESGNNVSFEVTNLFRWFDKENITKFVHPLTKQELLKHKDEQIRKTMLAKLQAYDELPILQCESDDYFESVISKYPLNDNSKIDNALLKEVYVNNVNILLTDDNVMLLKAEELYIRDKVVTSEELLKIFESYYPHHIEYKMLAVKLKDFAEINLSDNFFDSLREDYEGVKFDNWFKKKALKKEKAYVFENNSGHLQGFLYLKEESVDEDYSDITPQLPPKKRLKIGTFKIESTGFRLGERFLKIIFDNALLFNVDEIYVTLFEDKRKEVINLKNLMELWGFVKHGHKSNGELVMTKTMRNYYDDKDSKFNYPITRPNKEYFFLPIDPQYHTDLFPDMILKNEDMHLYQDNFPHRYAVEKIYLTGAFDIKAKHGDLILIYRNGERYPKRYFSVVTGLAIVEDIIKTTTSEECIKLCQNRSIFNESEIRRIHNRRPIIVKLLDFVSFKKKVTLGALYDNNIVAPDTGPRPFTQITEKQFNIIYKLGMED